MKLHGAGTVVAAILLGHIGDIRRFPTAGHFATYCGVAPLEAPSGDVIRHRLSRLGDRQLNSALYIMALTQARSHPLGRAYYLRKQTEGHSKAEALRCLKRRLAQGTAIPTLGTSRTLGCFLPAASCWRLRSTRSGASNK